MKGARARRWLVASAPVSGPFSGPASGPNPSAVPAAASPVATVLTASSSTVDGTSVPTTSITPVANRPVYAGVTAFSAVSLTVPTASGNGLTWVQVATIAIGLSRQLTVFRALGAAPSLGSITFDFGVVTQTSFVWSVIQYAGADAGGTNGSAATPQFVTQQVTAATSITINLAGSLVAPSSRMLVFSSGSGATGTTKDPLFDRLAENSIGTNNSRLASDHAINRTGCTTAFASQDMSSIALEVKAA